MLMHINKCTLTNSQTQNAPKQVTIAIFHANIQHQVNLQGG